MSGLTTKAYARKGRLYAADIGVAREHDESLDAALETPILLLNGCGGICLRVLLPMRRPLGSTENARTEYNSSSLRPLPSWGRPLFSVPCCIHPAR